MTRLTVLGLEDRLPPAADALTLTAPLTFGAAVAAAGPAVTALAADGTALLSGSPFAGVSARAAVADVDGDGTPDLIAVPQTEPGKPAPNEVAVYSGRTGKLLRMLPGYEGSFAGGMFVAAADLTNDGKAEVVIGADLGGGPRVRVFDGASITGEPRTLADFLAIDDANFRGGVRLALGDLNNDGVPDLAVGAGFQGGPRVAAYDGAALGRGQITRLFNDFFAFEQALRNGVYLSVADVDGDGVGDLVFGGGPGGGPRVRAASGAMLLGKGGGSLDDFAAGTQLANFFAGDPNTRLGVQVSAATGGGKAKIVTVDNASKLANLFAADGSLVGAVAGLSNTTSYTAAAYSKATAAADAARQFVSDVRTRLQTNVRTLIQQATAAAGSNTALIPADVQAALTQLQADVDANQTLAVLTDLQTLGTRLLTAATSLNLTTLLGTGPVIVDPAVLSAVASLTANKAEVAATMQALAAAAAANIDLTTTSLLSSSVILPTGTDLSRLGRFATQAASLLTLPDTAGYLSTARAGLATALAQKSLATELLATLTRTAKV